MGPSEYNCEAENYNEASLDEEIKAKEESFNGPSELQSHDLRRCGKLHLTICEQGPVSASREKDQRQARLGG